MRSTRFPEYQIMNAKPRPASAPLGDGPGTELKALWAAWNVTPPPGCTCEAVARDMNTWGADGCKERRNEIIGRIEDNKAKWTWAESVWNHLKAGTLALASGIVPTIGAMVDEAIRRAEAKQLEKKNRNGRDAAGRRVVNLLDKGYCRGLGDAITWAWLATGCDEPLTFACSGGVQNMLELFGVPTCDDGNGGLDVDDCHKREMAEQCTRPRCEVWYDVLGLTGTAKRPPLNIRRDPQPHRIALAPECAHLKRTWPRHRWDALAKQLEAAGFEILWILKAKRWTYLELARQLASCALLIGNDSMPAHMAGTLDVPALVLFSVTHAQVMANYNRITAIEGGPKIDAITVPQVYQTALRIMGEK